MKALKSTFIYLFSTLIEKGMAFLLIPLYTHYLSTSDYGILNVLQALIGILIIIFTFSLNGAASRYHFDGNNLYRRFHYGNIFLTITFISVVMACLLFLFKDYIFNLLGNIPISPYFYLVIVIVYTNAIYMLYQLKLQMEHRALEYGLNNVFKFFISTLFAVIFIIFFGKKADGVLEGSAISLLVFNFYIFIKLKKEKIKFNFNKRLLKRNIKYSIFLIPHNLAGIFMQFMDRFFISNMINLSQVGIYSLGGQISGVLGIISSALNNATVPNVLKAYKDENYLYLIDLADLSIVFLSFIAFMLSLFSPEIVNLIAPDEYKNAYLVISILSFYFVVQMYYFMTSSVLFYIEKATKFVSIATITSFILNIILNYLLIPYFSIIGAAIATVVSILLVNYFVIFIANKFILVKFRHIKIHFVILSAIILGNLNLFFELNIILKLLVAILYLFLLFFVIKIIV